jgi:hypothetical protein
MKQSTLLLLVLFLAGQLAPTGLSGQCAPGNKLIDLDINNVRALISNRGDQWWDGTTGVYLAPWFEGSMTSSIFAGSLWMGGVSPGGNLKVAGETYGAQLGTSDFFPGPLDPVTGTVTVTECSNWNKFFLTTITDIDQHKADFDDNGMIDGPIPLSILGWPAQGNPSFFDIHGFDLPDQDLAPFFDRDENGIYNPELGDFPLVKGELSIWWVYNDAGNVHTSTGGDILRMEIQANAFSYNGDTDAVDNTTFYEYKLTYRGTEPLDSTYVGLWVDPDLGCYQDDYVGCDPDAKMGFVYNGDAFDEDCAGITGYQDEIPALGVKILKSMETPGGEEAPFAHFTYYLNGGGAGGPATADPNTPNQFYNYLSGSWNDGTPLSQGGNGYNPGAPPYPYAFDNSTVNNEPWNECTADTDPDDRRFIMSFGPMDLQPGEVRTLSFAVIWKPAQNYPCPDLSGLIQDGADIEQFYQDKCDEIMMVNSLHDPDAGRKLVKVFPNPMHDLSTLEVFGEGLLIESAQLLTLDGRQLQTFTDLHAKALTIDRSGLANGIYFYRVQLNNGTIQTGKLVIE